MKIMDPNTIRATHTQFPRLLQAWENAAEDVRQYAVAPRIGGDDVRRCVTSQLQAVADQRYRALHEELRRMRSELREL